MQPRPGGGLTSAEAQLLTLYGGASSGWALSDGKVTVFATIPPNARGTVRLPAADLTGVTEGGQAVSTAHGVKQASADGGDVVVEVGSGRYQFVYDAARLLADLQPVARLSTLAPIGIAPGVITGAVLRRHRS